MDLNKCRTQNTEHRKAFIFKMFLIGMLVILLGFQIDAYGEIPSEPTPDISVDPLTVDFVNVNIDSSSERIVTVSNEGNVVLAIGAITYPQAPFNIVTGNCSGQSIAPSASCTITVSFSPTAEGTFNDIFDIPSDDPDENPVTVTLTGTGTGTPSGSPDITVIPTTLNFLNILIGATADQTITVKNEGSADLIISNITSPSEPFSIITEDCSGQTFAPTGLCTIKVRFAPTTSGTFNSSFDIPSDDPDENPVTAGLSGSGMVPGNNPPAKPALTYPSNGAADMPTTLTLKWDKSTDPDGDTITYKLYIGTDTNLIGIEPIDYIASITNTNNISYAVASGYHVGVIALFGIVAIGGLSRKRKKIGFLIVIVIFAGGLFFSSCGAGGGGGGSSSSDDGDTGDSEDTISYEIQDLQTETDYYWKVVADDGNGGVTESDTYSFKTAL